MFVLVQCLHFHASNTNSWADSVAGNLTLLRLRFLVRPEQSQEKGFIFTQWKKVVTVCLRVLFLNDGES